MIKIIGKVIKGKGEGKKLGFPTANLALGNDFRGESGVYAGYAYFGGKNYKSAIFIGSERNILEAHILDFNGDLYGREMVIEIGQKIRKVMKFENSEDLKKQIARDIKKMSS